SGVFGDKARSEVASLFERIGGLLNQVLAINKDNEEMISNLPRMKHKSLRFQNRRDNIRGAKDHVQRAK
ncbi:MAG: hypothetical protein KAI64_04535, partial [Thermoplasmata archaeon]|nr:hypothetical protein [Thermoplasmata archaeon]